jgi:hypothetical protein
MTGRGNPEPDLPPVVVPCDQLTVELVLVDVVLGVATSVAPGQSLGVALIESRYPAVFLGPERVGSVASGGALSRLVECLRAGQAFSAIALEVDEAYVRVRIGAG